MNKAVLFLAALGASTALCAPVPAEKAEKRDTIPIARVPDVPPPSRETLDASIRKAADFLLKEQNRDGSWGNHTRTKGLNVLCPYPEGPRSFRTASTSLCVIGLLTSPLKEDPAVKASLDKALQYLLTTLPTLKRGDTRTVLGVWGHAYGLSALSRARGTFLRMPLCAKNSKRWPPSKSKRWTRWRTSKAAGAITHLKLFPSVPLGNPLPS